VLLRAATKPPETIPRPEYIPEVGAQWEEAYGPGGINRQVWVDYLERAAASGETNIKPGEGEKFYEGAIHPRVLEAVRETPVHMIPKWTELDDMSTQYTSERGAARWPGDKDAPWGIFLEEGEPKGVFRHEGAHAIDMLFGEPGALGTPLSKMQLGKIQELFPEVGDEDVMDELVAGGADIHSRMPWEVYANIITTRATLGRLFTADDVKFWRTVDTGGLDPGLLNTYGDLIDAVQRGNSDFSDQEIADRLNRIAKVETTPGPGKGLV
jgi:hypothetical protein